MKPCSPLSVSEEGRDGGRERGRGVEEGDGGREGGREEGS